jgi:hypothetical protein
MGSLTPGATLIYERVDGVVYAREAGTDSSTRQVVGYESGRDHDLARGSKINWYDVLELAKTNTALADAVNRVIMLYELSKANE